MRASYLRLFADSSGESRFEIVQVPMDGEDFAPPAAPLLIGQLSDRPQAVFYIDTPPGWDGLTFHPTPVRQLLCVVEGRYEMTTSTGDKRQVGPGDVVLLDDTHGKGHTTEPLDARGGIFLAVSLD